MGSTKLMRCRTMLVVGLIALLGACATAETKVSCEGRLQPINPPSVALAVVPAKTPDHSVAGVSP